MKRIKELLKNNLLEKISFIIMIISLIILLFGPILITYKFLSLKEFSKFLLFLLPIEIIIYILSKIKEFDFSIYEKLLFLIMIFSTISVLNSKYPEVSIYGFSNRYEGLLMLWNYFFLALTGKNIKNKDYQRIIIKGILCISTINIIYGLFQIGLLKSIIPIKGNWYYAKGFEGNSMYYASLLSIGYAISLGLVLNYNNKKYYLLYLLLTIGNVISGSMALFLTTIILYILLGINELIKRKKHISSNLIKVIICFIIFISISIIFMNNTNNYKEDLTSFKTEVSTITTTGNINNNFGTGRIYIWKSTLSKVKDNIIFGVGIDQFYYSFKPRLIDKVSNLPVDKAHNDYLQKLYCEGLLSFITYLCLFVLIIINTYKTKDKIKRLLFLSFLSYSIEIFFSISVIRVAPIYWIIIGLLISDNEKVSIIIPIYNSEKYLKKCLNSVINQTYKDIEIILIDDATSDNSKIICESYQDNRIKYIRNNINKGVSISRNIGLKESCGKYITFIDSDDYVDDDYIEILLNNLKNYNCDISIVSYYQKNNKIYTNKISSKEALKKVFMNDNLECSVVSKLYKRKVFNKIKFPEGKIYEDIIVFGKILLNYNNIVYSTIPKYHYNKHNNSLTFSKYQEREKNRIELSKELLEEVTRKHTDIEVYAKYFYINNRIAVCNKLLEIGKYNDIEITKTREYIKKNLNEIFKLKISNIKKTQILLFIINPLIYIKIYGIIKPIVFLEK